MHCSVALQWAIVHSRKTVLLCCAGDDDLAGMVISDDEEAQAALPFAVPARPVAAPRPVVGTGEICCEGC